MESKNKWETQPRETNGQFGERPKTLRLSLGIWQKALDGMAKVLHKKVDQNAKGGSYGELRKETAGNKSVEIHHMPADSTSPLSRWKGPCITLEKEEHQKTASHPKTDGSSIYREKQRKLIKRGKFFSAEILDILDIIKKTGIKYFKALSDKVDYEIELYKRGEIHE